MTSIDPVLAFIVDDLAALELLGVNMQISVALGNTFIVGTPISEAEYFKRLGERYHQALEPQTEKIRFHSGPMAYEAERWSEDRVWRMPHNRKRGIRRFGEFAQDETRRRVQERLTTISESSPSAEEERATRELLSGFFGDDTAPTRQYLHLKGVQILSQPGKAPLQVPFWRLRLSDVTGWDLESDLSNEE